MGRTSIIIVHRLSTIMKHGKIVQEGKHFKLIQQIGEYKKLWKLQKGWYIGEWGSEREKFKYLINYTIV